MSETMCDSCGECCLVEFYQHENGNFHKECFRCVKCNCFLKTSNWGIKAGKLYCPDHLINKREFNCGVCHYPILSDRLSLMELYFHRSCFHCSICLKCFNKNDRIHWLDSTFFCESCVKQVSQLKRQERRKKVISRRNLPKGQCRNLTRTIIKSSKVSVEEFQRELSQRLKVQYQLCQSHVITNRNSSSNENSVSGPVKPSEISTFNKTLPTLQSSTGIVKSKNIDQWDEKIVFPAGNRIVIQKSEFPSVLLAKPTSKPLFPSPSFLPAVNSHATMQMNTSSQAHSVANHVKRPSVSKLIKTYEDISESDTIKPVAITPALNGGDSIQNPSKRLAREEIPAFPIIPFSVTPISNSTTIVTPASLPPTEEEEEATYTGGSVSEIEFTLANMRHRHRNRRRHCPYPLSRPYKANSRLSRQQHQYAQTLPISLGLGLPTRLLINSLAKIEDDVCHNCINVDNKKVEKVKTNEEENKEKHETINNGVKAITIQNGWFSRSSSMMIPLTLGFTASLAFNASTIFLNCDYWKARILSLREINIKDVLERLSVCVQFIAYKLG